jgi:hypothetical protein
MAAGTKKQRVQHAMALALRSITCAEGQIACARHYLQTVAADGPLQQELSVQLVQSDLCRLQTPLRNLHDALRNINKAIAEVNAAQKREAKKEEPVLRTPLTRRF